MKFTSLSGQSAALLGMTSFSMQAVPHHESADTELVMGMSQYKLLCGFSARPLCRRRNERTFWITSTDRDEVRVSS